MSKKRTYKIAVTLTQTGWVEVKADSLEEAIMSCQQDVSGDLWPLSEPVGEEFSNYEYDRADIEFRVEGTKH